MIRGQSNTQWSGGIATHPAPKHVECKNPLENSRLHFLASSQRTHHGLSSKEPNYKRGVLLNFAVAIEGHLKNAGISPMRS
jgi:hypothetical protein